MSADRIARYGGLGGLFRIRTGRSRPTSQRFSQACGRPKPGMRPFQGGLTPCSPEHSLPPNLARARVRVARPAPAVDSSLNDGPVRVVRAWGPAAPPGFSGPARITRGGEGGPQGPPFCCPRRSRHRSDQLCGDSPGRGTAARRRTSMPPSDQPPSDNPYARRSAWGRPRATPFVVAPAPKVAAPRRPSTILTGSAIPLAPRQAAEVQAQRQRPSSILTGSAMPPPAPPAPGPTPQLQPAPRPAPPPPEPAAIAREPVELAPEPMVSPVLAGVGGRGRSSRASRTPLLVGAAVVGLVGIAAVTALILTRQAPAPPIAAAPAVEPAVVSPAAPGPQVAAAPEASPPTTVAAAARRVARAEAATAAPPPARAEAAPPLAIAVEPAPLVIPPAVRPAPVQPAIPAQRPPADPDAPLTTRLPEGNS